VLGRKRGDGLRLKKTNQSEAERGEFKEERGHPIGEKKSSLLLPRYKPSNEGKKGQTHPQAGTKKLNAKRGQRPVTKGGRLTNEEGNREPRRRRNAGGPRKEHVFGSCHTGEGEGVGKIQHKVKGLGSL